MKLRRVREGDLVRLRGHRAADLLDAVPDAYHRGLAGGVQKSPAIRSDDPRAFAADCDRISFAKIARKKRRRMNCRGHTELVTKKLSRKTKQRGPNGLSTERV